LVQLFIYLRSTGVFGLEVFNVQITKNEERKNDF